MKRISNVLFVSMFGLVIFSSLMAQTTETFEDETAGTTSFTHSGHTFGLTGKFDVENYPGWGYGNSNFFVDNYGNNATASPEDLGSVTLSSDDFFVHSLWLFPSEDGTLHGTGGSAVIRGKLNSATQFTHTVETGDWGGSTANNGFTYVDFGANSSVKIDELEFEVTGSLVYLAIDNFEHEIFTATTPSCTTNTASSVTTSSAMLGGVINNDGGASVSGRGVVYSSSDSSPTIGEPGVIQDTNGTGTGTFSELIGSLSSGTVYWFRAYATNSAGTSYGDTKACTTLVEITFTNGADAALDFQQTNAAAPENNWLCGQFRLNCSNNGATLNSITVTLGGTYDSEDLQSTPFQLFTSNTNSFGSAATVGSSVADPGSGNDVIFSSLSNYLISGTHFYWVTADISALATADDNMTGTVSASGDLSITGGELTGSSSYGKLNAGSEASLPVEISTFSAEPAANGILIKWTTESEVNNLGFILESKFTDTDWIEIASYKTHPVLKGQGNTSTGTDYSFTDTKTEPGKIYNYRLSDVSTAGKIHIYDVIQIALPDAPKETALEMPFPNPFNPKTRISYQLAQSGRVEITVYDMLGRKVSTLLNAEQNVGSYNIYWHGKDDFGRQAASGMYILRMIAGDVMKSQKVSLMR